MKKNKINVLIVSLRRHLLRFATCLLLCALPSQLASAQTTIFDDARTIADNSVVVAAERRFQIDNTGSYDLTITDLGALATPAQPLTNIRVAITRGNELVRQFTATGTTTAINLTVGEYVVRVAGRPDSQIRSGSVGLIVRPSSATTDVLSFSTALSLAPNPQPANVDVLDSRFDIQTAGSYELTLIDLGFPQALDTLTLALTRTGNQTQVSGFPMVAAGVRQFTAQPGSYSLFALASSAASVRAGIYSVKVRNVATGTVVFESVRPIGRVRNAGAAALAAGSAVLSLSDLSFPVALARRGALVWSQGQIVAQTQASGDTAFTAVAGSHVVYLLTEPSTPTGQGALAYRLTNGANTALADAAIVSETAASQVFKFTANIPTAGAYRLRLSDFQFPASLSSVRLLVTQGSGPLGELAATGSVDLNSLAAQPLVVLVQSQSSAQAGIFGLEVAPSAGGAAVFDVNQGVGALFTTQRVAVTAAARYNVRLTDLGFPAAFAEIFAVVTRGTERVGSIVNGGTFSIDATPGSYFVSFLARPSAAEAAGTYSLNVSESPPPPVITFSANANAVQAGNTVQLTWSVQNATTCTASGGWSGSRASSGTETSSTVSAATTFTLSCNGAGGGTSRSITVDIAPPQSSGSGGGGGAVSSWVMLLLAFLLVPGIPWRRLR